MTPQDLESVQRFFDSYAETFIQTHQTRNAPYILKRDHTRRVVANIRALGLALDLEAPARHRALAAGILHDVGRFPQFRDHGTFADIDSVDHARLSVETIESHGVLDAVPQEDGTAILTAVKVHNAYHLPRELPPDHLVLAKILRDGDKLDILQVMADKYLRDRQAHSGRSSDEFITMDLPGTEEVSAELVAMLKKRQMLDRRKVASLNDLKLLQISWVFDLNFAPAVALLRERQLIETIFSTLPRTGEMADLEGFILADMDGRMGLG